jgi:hypothetical protein
MFKALILLPLLAFMMLSMQACFESSSSGQSASQPAACDAQGNNCQSTTTTRSSWGFLF